jgi:hypothetical protein
MKTTFYKHLLFAAGILITGIAMAQTANNTVVPFKEIQRKQSTDNFTAREIKKKELEIAPSQIVLLNIGGNPRQLKKSKIGKRKGSAFNYFSSLYIPINFFDSRLCWTGLSNCCASILNFSDRSSAALKTPVEM